MASSSDVGEIPKVSAKDIKYDETPIGRGGYGYVYRGVHKDLGTVAIKTMIADGLLPSRHQRIFKAEGKKLWELKHTSIVRLLGLIMEENNYSLILEYMHFGSLTAFRSDFVDIDWSLLVSVIRDVIHGMEYLHGPDPPILHLDLKSDNILINRRIRAKITDFGLSQWKTMTRTMTRSQGGEEKGRKGTVTHVPPEVWNNINTAPNKGYDVYSFGIVLWETVVGDRPFARVSDDIIPKAVLSGQRPDMTMIPSQCPREVMEMMTRCWTQQSDKRPTFAEMKVEIDALFEKLAPAVPEALGKLEKEIAGLYDAEDLGGDTAATADSESIFDAATKLTKPLTNLSTTSPQSVQMEDIGEEEDVPKTTGPPVPNGQSLPIVGLQDEAPSGPSRGASTTAASSSTSKAPAATGAGSASQAKPKPQAASTTATATATSATTTATSGSSTSGATTAPAAAPAAAPGPFVMTEEQKKALRRVLRDPVGMLLMHKDAQLCKKVFGVDLELQKKIKDPKELLKLLEKDPLLRMELKRKGAEHVGWLFFPHRMKDEIRRKRPNRTPKPEAVNRMKTLREERQKRESKNTPKMDFDHKEKKSSGIASGLMGLFKKDKYKKMEKDPMSKYMDPYHDPYSDMMDMRRSMGMGSLAPDMSYKLKRALRDPQMIRYILREETPPRISPVDREVMDVIRDPDKLLEYMRQDPKLLDILVATDKEALMKLVARSRGPQSRHMRNMRGPRRMPGMYRGLEMDMMDMDLEDEMMMNPGRYERHKQTRELMDMLKNPGLPSSLMDPSSSSSSSRPSTVSRPPNTPPASTSAAASATNTAASNTGPSKVNTAANSNTTPGPGSKGPSPTKAATIPLKSSATESKDASKSATTNISQTGGSAIGAAVVGVVGAGVAGADNQKPQEPERREIKGLPDDHLVKRQENIKMPVQRHTDTEPLQTAYGFAKGFLNQTNSKSVPKTPTTNASNSQTASSTTSAASSTSGQGQTSTTQGQASGGTQNSSAGQSQSSSGQGQSSSGQGQSSSGQGQRPGSNTTSGAQPGSGTTFRAQPQFQNFNDPTSIHVELNADGSMSGDFNPLSLPAGVQFGENNVMVLNCDDDGNVSRNDISGAGSTRKRSTDYRSKFKKMSKKHRSVLGRGEEIDFDHVNLIADDIGPKWMDLAVEVEMKGEKLRDLKLEYKMNKGQDDYDYCMRVINDLLQRKPFFTLRDLILSLKEIDCQKTAIKLIEFVP
ncbi:uncharacterized protein LOC124148256 isoform X1 [Haliotis rufescens]|uniref:uncharacterized protein LOC124148256 isoform X1 n=1 Tax=Haliotis rufescens TaxID=6454 RepID=UPI00201F8314|nr:uncharacterized protein LOC124148256 isoform X1 [Haliotis rufescens]